MTRLFTTMYPETQSLRLSELSRCLHANFEVFGSLYVLCESRPCSPIGIVRIQEKRPTYHDVLCWAAEVCDENDLCVIANTDIAIPIDSIAVMQERLRPFDAWCLSRWDVIGEGRFALHESANSQDTWCFRGPPRIIDADYHFGIPGCDNRFAHDLQSAGYVVSNPSRSVKTFHYHQSSIRTATNSKANRLGRPWLFVEPTAL
jgi:hypothetical protein